MYYTIYIYIYTVCMFINIQYVCSSIYSNYVLMCRFIYHLKPTGNIWHLESLCDVAKRLGAEQKNSAQRNLDMKSVADHFWLGKAYRTFGQKVSKYIKVPGYLSHSYGKIHHF